MKNDPPFKRTECACGPCAAHCKRQPGQLIPRDFARIAEHLGVTEEELAAKLWASPGAIVGQYAGGGLVLKRVGTVTPRMEGGQCVFLTAEGRCSIHPVSPFGCAYFDDHIGAYDARRRSEWGIREIITDAEYQERWQRLPRATSWNPTPRMEEP